MNQRLILKELNCPHCTAVIEEKVSSLPYVEKAVFNTVTKIMDIKLKENSSSLFNDVNKIVKQTEPSVSVLPYEENTVIADEDEDEDGITRLHIIRLFAGGMLLAGGIFTKMPVLSLSLYILSYIVFGYDVVLKAIKNILRGEVFDENFLMSAATIGAFFTGKYAEAVSVMLFYQIGELFQDMAVGKASRSVKSLLNIMPDTANLISGEGITTLPSKNIKPGDTILVRPGEKIPLDGTVTEGSSFIDKKNLTGESLPEEIKPGDIVLSGEINGASALKVKVTKAYENSTAQKIVRLTEEASAHKSKAERFITRFAKIYTPAVVFSAIALAVIPPIFTGFESFSIWFDRALIFLVASCPCALVVSIPLGFFAGSGKASSKGVLIKGSTFIQTLSETDTVVFDKTGTLTEGIFKIEETEPQGVSEKELLRICGSAEENSSHPIARAIYNETKKDNLPEITSFEEISGMGIKAEASEGTILAGNKALMDKFGIEVSASDDSETTVYTALNGRYIGLIRVADTVKKDSASAIASLKAKGIKTVLLTGDKRKSAEKLNKNIKIDEIHSDLLPADKLSCLEELYKNGSKKVAYLGDGINDAPVLRRADVGIAMGGLGSDTAIEAADCVIMSDEPSKVLDAIEISKQTMRRIRQNTTFVIAFKLFVLVISAIGFGNMWLAVFADIGTALLAILNSIR